MKKQNDYNQLFEAYKRGDSPGDSVELHYLSQIPDLTRSEFVNLAGEIESIAGQYMGVATGSAPLSHLSGLSPAIEQATASKPFAPTRTATGKPIDIDPDDYQKTAETLRGLTEGEVKHDVDLHTIWKLANEGRLAGGSDTKPAKDTALDLYDAYRGGKQSLDGQFSGLMTVAGQFKNPLSEDGFAELKEQLEAISVQHATNIAAGANKKQAAINEIITRVTIAEAARPKTEKPFDLRQENVSQQSELGKPKPVAPEPFSVTVPITPAPAPPSEKPANPPVEIETKPVVSRSAVLLASPALLAATPENELPPDEEVKAAWRKLQAGKPQEPIASHAPTVPIPQELPAKAPEAINATEPVINPNPIPPRQPIKVTSNDILKPMRSEGIQSPSPQPASWGKRTLDWIQRGADALGVIDQTGLTDMANSTISFARAAGSKGDNEQREHLINAGVSMVSAIPIVGDAAKVWKYNRLAKQSFAAGGGVNAAGQPVTVAPPLQTGGSGGMVPPIVPPPGSPPPPGDNDSTPSNGFWGRIFRGGNNTPPVVPPGLHRGLGNDSVSDGNGNSQQVQTGGGGFFGNNISQLFGGNATQGGSGYFANGGGFFGGGTGSNSPGQAAATQVANRAMTAVNTGVQGIAMGAAAAGMAIPGLQPFALALGASVRALEAFNAGIEAVDRTNQAIIEGNRDLSQYNGGLAGAYVNYDARAYERDIERSNDMESVLPDLMDRQSSFADAQQDLYGPFAQAGVVIQTKITEAATSLVKIVDWLEPFSEMVRNGINEARPPVNGLGGLGARNGFEQAINNFTFGPIPQGLVNPPPLPGGGGVADPNRNGGFPEIKGNKF